MLQNFLCPYFTNVGNKLECFSLASLTLRVSPSVEHLKGASLG